MNVPHHPHRSHPLRWLFCFRELIMSKFEIVQEIVCTLDESQREAYEERAGILEFDVGLQRDLAEALALLHVLRPLIKRQEGQS